MPFRVQIDFKGNSFMKYWGDPICWLERQLQEVFEEHFDCYMYKRENKMLRKSMKHGFSSCYKIQWLKFNLEVKKCLRTMQCGHPFLIDRTLNGGKSCSRNSGFTECSTKGLVFGNIIVVENIKSILIHALFIRNRKCVAVLIYGW